VTASSCQEKERDGFLRGTEKKEQKGKASKVRKDQTKRERASFYLHLPSFSCLLDLLIEKGMQYEKGNPTKKR